MATIDIETAFLYETIMTKLWGKMMELLVQLKPNIYQKYVTTGPKEEPTLYVKLLNALYGLLRSALLFCKKLRGNHKDMGFKINPYNLCVANKMINGSQMTVTWHVDGLKASYKENTEVTKFVMALSVIYGNGFSVTWDKVHLYLGMDFDYATNVKVKLSMIPYAKQINDDFPKPITCTAPAPAAEHIFQVRPNCGWFKSII